MTPTTHLFEVSVPAVTYERTILAVGSAAAVKAVKDLAERYPAEVVRVEPCYRRFWEPCQ